MGGVSEFCDNTINSIENIQLNNNILVYPNPVLNNLTIEVPQKAVIEILNIEGQIIKTINDSEKKTTIDLKNLSNGIYMINIKTDNEFVTKKFIKE